MRKRLCVRAGKGNIFDRMSVILVHFLLTRVHSLQTENDFMGDISVKSIDGAICLKYTIVLPPCVWELP